jgi:hypothetical protein
MELAGIEVPAPGHGVLREVQDLMDDGITSRDRGMTARAETCSRRATTLLSLLGTGAPDLDELLASDVAEERR